MDRTIAAAARGQTSPGHPVLRLAAPVDVREGDGPTRVFWPEAASEILPRSPLCQGDGTAATTTTITAVAAEPAPAVLAEQAPLRMDDLLDVDPGDVLEVLEGRLELELSDSSGTLERNTQVGAHVPRAPVPEHTRIAATVLHAPVDDRTRVTATVLRQPADEGTRVAAHVPREPVASESLHALGVPVPIAPERHEHAVPATREVTSVRMVPAGRYLGDAISGDAVRHRVGSSLVLARTPGSPFEDDPYVDAQHAALTFRPDGVVVDDFDSTNGVFVRVHGSMALRSGDTFRIGEELLRYVAIKPALAAGRAPAFGSPDPGYWGRIDVMIAADVHAASYPVDDIDVTLGQSAGHLQFPDDPFLSPLHARLVRSDRGAVLEDLGGETGTWLRLRSGDVVAYGSELLVGGTRVLVDRG